MVKKVSSNKIQTSINQSGLSGADGNLRRHRENQELVAYEGTSINYAQSRRTSNTSRRLIQRIYKQCRDGFLFVYFQTRRYISQEIFRFRNRRNTRTGANSYSCNSNLSNENLNTESGDPIRLNENNVDETAQNEISTTSLNAINNDTIVIELPFARSGKISDLIGISDTHRMDSLPMIDSRHVDASDKRIDEDKIDEILDVYFVDTEKTSLDGLIDSGKISNIENSTPDPDHKKIEKSAVTITHQNTNSFTSEGNQEVKKIENKNRCAVCRKKVGLTGGITCRCGGLFCAIHRYSDKHECPVDYRALGAEEIRRNNPKLIPDRFTKL